MTAKSNCGLVTGLIASLCSGCQHSSSSLGSPILGRDYNIVVRQDDSMDRFEMELVSTSTRAICVAAEDWPNSLGTVAGGRAYLQIWEKGLYSRDIARGFCVGPKCETIIPSQSRLTGFVNYAEFGDANSIRSTSSKSMIYDIRPYFCSSSNRYNAIPSQPSLH